MVSRRDFLALTAAGAFHAPWLAAQRRPAPMPGPRATGTVGIDGTRLRARLEHLSTFGRPEGGTFAAGVSRVAYSDADVAARAWLMQEMKAAGLTPRVDPAGNIFASRPGATPGAPPILFGSHIDSVPGGGNFDGTLGSLAALEVMQACEAAGLRTRHPLEMVVWAHEEGVAFTRGLAGSRIVAGDLQPGDLAQTWNGLTRADAIRKIGGAPDRIEDAVRPQGAHHAYIELHIEQGGTLDARKVPIGIVQGIVAIHRYEMVITGMANHAGTTPMSERQDALVAASRVVLAARAAAMTRDGRQVATVGRLDVTPNAPNVIPGQAALTIELRDLSPDVLTSMADEIRQRAAAICDETGTSMEMRRVSENPPAAAAAAVQEAVIEAAGTAGLPALRLPSGAGHDAQMMARLSPMGMIFVPSVGGISHSPRELTSWDDCARGAAVLLGAVLALDGSSTI